MLLPELDSSGREGPWPGPHAPGSHRACPGGVQPPVAERELERAETKGQHMCPALGESILPSAASSLHAHMNVRPNGFHTLIFRC